ncbi:putative phage abortive infection protein [Rhizorhabdus dicambivorans]|uniref:Phage abortive infection protein n=1 Tax=Rhizorhabdus dicambivorans TaxID=1850238 RepID=A0A2A4G116_9SPHN|nr:hypothetical protein CMV14_02815 [Rhizorhabdus dicambivorans]PCE43685.1 hypothetical protein COO09_05135 [Rhizorhabdus dicambivorans]
MNRLFTSFLCAIVITVWLLWAHYSPDIAAYFLWLSDSTVSTAGTWGDSFGPLNALISSFAFIGVCITLFTQSDAIKIQTADTHRQRFESSFFEIIRIMKEVRDNISFTNSRDYSDHIRKESGLPPLKKLPRYSNIKAIRQCVKEIQFWLVRNKIAFKPDEDQMKNIYMRSVHSRFESTLSPYFRLIYTTLKKINDDKILNDGEKIYYANLLRSQLTSFEIILIGINALCPISNDFKKYVSHFRLLKYVPKGRWRQRLRLFYDDEVFAGRDD